MGIVRQAVEEQVGQAKPRQVVGLRPVGCEEYARPRHALRLRCLANIVGKGRRALQQPQQAAVHLFQNAHPARKGIRRQLVGIVEVAEHKAVCRKSGFRAAGGGRQNAALAVVGLVAAGQGDDLLVIKALLIVRDHDAVGDDVIDIGCA